MILEVSSEVDRIGDTIEERVEEGFPWVLREWPSLLKNADLEKLDMTDNCRCLVAQTFGTFEEGVSQMGLTIDDVLRYGLGIDLGEDLNLEDFTPVWKAKIEAWRQNA